VIISEIQLENKEVGSNEVTRCTLLFKFIANPVYVLLTWLNLKYY